MSPLPHVAPKNLNADWSLLAQETSRPIMLRLINNEIVISRNVKPFKTNDGTEYLILRKPRTIVMQPNQQGQISLILVPFGAPLMPQTESVTLQLAHVLMPAPANDEIAAAYIQETSGIIAPPNGLLKN